MADKRKLNFPTKRGAIAVRNAFEGRPNDELPMDHQDPTSVPAPQMREEDPHTDQIRALAADLAYKKMQQRQAEPVAPRPDPYEESLKPAEPEVYSASEPKEDPEHLQRLRQMMRK